MTGGSLPLIWRKFGERYDLDGNFCETCKTAYFPARAVCQKCRRKGKLVAQKMPKNGKIVSFTELSAGPAGFENEVPYFIAIIELENKARLLTQIVDSEKEKIKIGTKVEKVFRKISDIDPEGPIAYGYKFKVVE